MTGRAPDSLRVRIGRDLAPVSALPPPARRALPLLPVAAALLFASVAAFGLRGDAPALGGLLTWGASIAEACLGLLICAAALRESVPGTTLTRRALAALSAAAVLAITLITWLTWLGSQTRVAPQAVTWVWGVCLGATVSTALPPLALAGWLVARAFPLRPAIAGALCGLGAGLMADAGWRLFCHFSDPLHVFGSHTLGVLLLCGLGLTSAAAVAARRSRAGHTQESG